MLESVLTTGKAALSGDLLHVYNRTGYLEERYLTVSFNPIALESGRIGGSFSLIDNTTDRVIGERRLRTLRDLAAGSGDAKETEEACRIAADVLAENRYDLPIALLYLVAQGTTGETVATESGLRVWAGKAGDPFWIEPDVLHAVGHAFQDGTVVNLAGWDPSRAKNLFAGHTVYSIVLEVPDGELLAGAGDRRRIGVWAVATLATDAGGWRSINRVGLPMIHPLFTQYNEDLGTRLNAGRPSDDLATYGEAVTKAIAGVVSANGTAEDPKAYAEKVARRFFPNILPYEVGTPAVFSFAEWNGRSLTDNAPDVMFSIAANAPVRLGIGKESVTSKPSRTFPYVPPPLENSPALA
jgi:hypothetical protein